MRLSQETKHTLYLFVSLFSFAGTGKQRVVRSYTPGFDHELLASDGIGMRAHGTGTSDDEQN